ncbi:MAG: glycosyltransferase [Lachnospiraceae bacterium]|nr:glycosyltransferase [Lachnospiraceae bacterium]
MNKHTFVICAYKESPYLEDCICSLRAQTVKSRMIIVTSTPNDFIQNMAQKYQIPYYINEGEGGITQDWNFGYAKAGGGYITIAHQDDVYEKTYLARVLQAFSSAKEPLIYFCNYYEIRNGEKVLKNRLLRVKRLMLLPLRIPCFRHSIWVRRRILSFGTPICCPSVCYVSGNLPGVIFQNHYRACEDWEAWESISKRKGDFLYDPEPLMGHRIHADSETSSAIGAHKRTDEEYEMFRKFWPEWAARLIGRVYATGQNSNQV